MEALEDRTLLSAVVIEVTTLADVVDPDDGATSLREAVLAANGTTDDVEIHLTLEGTYTLTIEGVFEENAGTGDLDVHAGGSVTLVGLGVETTIIDAGDLGDRIFDVHAGAELNIQDVTLTGGSLPFTSVPTEEDFFGGAIRNIEGTVSISDSVLSGNAAAFNAGHGGAIFNGNGGTVTITSSTLSENAAGNSILNFGGAIRNVGSGSEVVITGSTLSDNTSGFGGAISNEDAGLVTITDSTLSGNLVNFNGGGIHNANGGTVTLTDSTLSGSATKALDNPPPTDGRGGGIDNQGGAVTVTNSTISGNTANGNSGGGIANSEGGVLDVSGSMFSGNSADFWGGGIANDAVALGTVTVAAVSNSTFVNNSAEAGGAMSNHLEVASFTVVDSTLSENVAGGTGGGIHHQGGQLILLGSTVSQNTLSGNTTMGGGIFITSATGPATVVITNSTISGNLSPGPDGSGAGGIHNENGSLTVTNSTVTANRAGATFGSETGGIWTRDHEDATTHLFNTLVAGNLVGEPGETSPSDLGGGAFGKDVEPDSAHNFIGDAGSAGGLVQGENGNIVGDNGSGTLDISTVLDTALADNGGPTLTHALVSGSPAINAGSNGLATDPVGEPLQFDQRGDGFSRILEGTVDIGAFEFGSSQGILFFDESTGRWHLGPNINQRFQQQLGSRWSTEVAWDFHHGDFTGNGLLDVAGRDPSNGQWWVLESTGDGFTTQFWGRWAADADAGWQDVQVGDFNGDGQDDIIGRTSTGQWWVAESTGERFANRFYGRWAADGWHATVVGDFNGDGRDGVAGIRTTNGQWWIAQPVDVNGAFRFSTAFAGRWGAPEDVGWQHLMAADFTGDGRSDVIGQTASGQWWLGAFDGTFLSNFFAGAWSPEAGIDEVFLGDFDGDGMTDLAGRNATGSWFVLRSNGLGERMTNERWGRWSADVEWTTLVGDFTGNGRDDIAGYVPTNGQLWVAVSDGERFENRFFGQWSPLNSVGFAAAGSLGG